MSTDRITTALAAIKALCEKATKGPWEASKVHDVGGAGIYGDINNRDRRCARLVANGVWTNAEDRAPHIVRPISVEECDANTAFIAASRETVERLVKFAEHQEETINSIINSDWMFHFRSLHKYLESRSTESAAILTGDKP